MKRIDQFLDYLYAIDENVTELTSDQVQKLETIKSKVSDIVKKVETYATAFTNDPHDSEISHHHIHQLANSEFAIHEEVHSFSSFTKINEKIAKHGNKWQVLNKKGTKVLGTHPTKKAAVKQLQAIEISKAKGNG